MPIMREADLAKMAGSGAARQQSAMALLKSVLVPRNKLHPAMAEVAPPNLYHETAFPKKLEATLNVLVGPDTVGTSLVAPYVPTQSGIILWLPNRGANSLARMGFVPSGTVLSVTATQPPTPAASGLYFPVRVNQSAVIQGINSLTFTAPLAVPYNNNVLTDQITIAPNLAQGFSTIRVFNGDLRAVCSTIPSGVFGSNGEWALTAVSDTRDIAQVQSSGASTYTAFDPGQMCQCAVTAKEGMYKEIDAQEGVLTLVGSDIPPFYTNPNADGTDTVRAQYASYPLSSFNSSVTMSSANSLDGAILATAWVSPWQITAGAVAGTPLNNVIVSPIDEFGNLDFQFRAFITGPDQNGGANAGQTTVLAIQFYHYFMTCSSTGAVSFTVLANDQKFSNTVVFASGNEPTHVCVHADAALGRTGFTTSGKYIGSVVQVSAYVIAAPTANAQIQYSMSSPILDIRARTLNERGWVGPARVIRWDGMGASQVLKITSEFHAQCIPSAVTAPYVQEQAGMSEEAVDLNVMPWLCVLFNGPTDIKRNWKIKEYEDFIKVTYPDLTPERILSWCPAEDESQKGVSKVIAGSEAAGIFSTLGGLAGSVLGGLAGHPNVGGALGGALGAGIDHFTSGVFGAGQFGPGMDAGAGSYGQFGPQSAAQFQACSGYGGGYGASSGTFGAPNLKRLRR